MSIISDYMINEQIRDREVRLIGEDGQQLGIMSSRDAMRMAREANLDLVKIAPTARPPVCKIIDYGKFRYEQARKDKEARKKQRIIEIKEIRLSPNIDSNDLNTKSNQARKFLSAGNKVKVAVRFRGREMTRTSLGKVILDEFAQNMSDVAVIDKPPKMEGRSMVMFLMPIGAKGTGSKGSGSKKQKPEKSVEKPASAAAPAAGEASAAPETAGTSEA